MWPGGWARVVLALRRRDMTHQNGPSWGLQLRCVLQSLWQRRLALKGRRGLLHCRELPAPDNNDHINHNT